MYRRALIAASILLLSACAPQQAAPKARTIVVFFTADSASLDAPAQSAIAQAAELARANPSAPVRVRGFAAPDSGSAAFNKSLSETRAHAVSDGLANAGVPRARIRVEPRGSVPFELQPTESRRVEIVIGT